MANPFKVDDVVYHATLGKGRVHSASAVSQYITALFSTDCDYPQTVEVSHCSFEPWPDPVHKRPLEDGWWVVTSKTALNAPLLRKLYDGRMRDADGRYTSDPNFYHFHKFLGKDWK